MKKDFAVFILSHRRAKQQITLNSLFEAGYTGEWYIIVDDTDEQLSEYLDLYGEHIIVFSKENMLKSVDTMTSTKELRSVLYARHYCWIAAKEKGLRYFGQFDDDLSKFSYKYIDNDGKLQNKKIKNIDAIFEALIEFLLNEEISSVNIPAQGAYFGGKMPEMKWNINQSFLAKVETQVPFVGILNEDINAVLIGAKSGKLSLEQYFVCKTDKKRGSNSGGLKNLYDATGEYERAFYTVICAPDCAKIKIKSNNKVIVTIKRENAFPKLINERWKKHRR